MTKAALLTSTAVALFLGLAPANAQMQQKDITHAALGTIAYWESRAKSVKHPTLQARAENLSKPVMRFNGSAKSGFL